jgi:hypothetical protein
MVFFEKNFEFFGRFCFSNFSKNGSEKFEKFEKNLLNLWYNLAAIWLIPIKKFEHFKGQLYTKMAFEQNWDTKIVF